MILVGVLETVHHLHPILHLQLSREQRGLEASHLQSADSLFQRSQYTMMNWLIALSRRTELEKMRTLFFSSGFERHSMR